MNIFRSIFISTFLTFVVYLTLYAAVEIARGMQPLLSWLGLLLSAGAPLVFFIRVFVSAKSVAVAHPIGTTMLCGLGLAITMAMSYRYADAAGSIHIWAGLCLLAWVTYLRWYSIFKERHAKALETGKQLPSFELEQLDGQLLHSNDIQGKPHILIFYRGNWCPFCTSQIADIAAQYRKFEQLGVKVLLISSQAQSHHEQLAERFDIPVGFLRDKNNNAARSLGIASAWGLPMGLQLLGYGSETVLPTVIITAADGSILWADQTDNYRVRPEPESLLIVLEQAGISAAES
jgi:peroxiredoxin